MSALRNLMSAVLVLMAGCTLPASQETSVIQGAPVVTIAAPRSDTVVALGVDVIIQALVTNAGSDIDHVEIRVDDEIIADLQTPNPAGAESFSITQTWPAETLGMHSVGITAYRADGTSSQPAVASFGVVEQATESVPPTEVVNPTDTNTTTNSQPTSVPTNVPEPTIIPETVTPNVPTARFTTGINVRSGPGTNFHPPVGQFSANMSAEILALNPAGSWLKVRYGSGEGWVFADLVEIQGDTSSLPREVGPPTPIPPTQTPIPPTPTTAVANNLVVEQAFIDPPQPQCGQPFRVGMSVLNDGSGEMSTGMSRIRILRAADGTEIATTASALIPVTLAAGGTHAVEFTFTVDVYVNETHRIEFIADADSSVEESIEADNIVTVDYTLPANCS